MINVHENGPQHNVAWTILPALLIPETGTALHTIVVPGAVKTLASVEMRTGDGLNRYARRVAIKAHDICQVLVHADIRDTDGELPLASDFHAPTLLWALENSAQIALWCEQGITRHAEVAAWTVNAAHAGSRFQTIINATPEHAAHWLAHVTRWKSKRRRSPRVRRGDAAMSAPVALDAARRGFTSFLLEPNTNVPLTRIGEM